MRTIRNVGASIFIGFTIYGSIVLGNIISRDMERERTEEGNLLGQTIRAITEARNLSAGEDRIWSDLEKRGFLDSFGFKNVILQEGQDIYFRRNETGAEIILGYNLENNGGFLTGSTANSGTSIGTVSTEFLERYVSRQRD